MSTTQLFYVFERIEGDECLLADRPDFAEAVAVTFRELAQRPDASLSICGSHTLGILALTDHHGILRITPRGESMGLARDLVPA